MFSVELNIPVPMSKKGPRSKYPFEDMAVGSSFQCEPGLEVSVYLCARAWAKRRGLNWKWSVKIDPDTGLHRCWRVS